MKRSIFLAVVCLAYAATASTHLTGPFTAYCEGLCGQYATIARATAVHGFAQTRLGLLEVAGPDLSVYGNWRDDYYPNRPPLSVLVPALFFRVLGAHEWVFRLNLILVGVCTILAFAGVARRLLAAPWDRVATACFAFLPLFNYFSHVVTHLDYVLLFSLLAWYANLRWDEGRRFRILLFAAIFLACQSDWPGYFAALSIAGYRFRGWKSGLSYGILAACGVFFALQLVHLLCIRPDGLLIKKFLLAGVDRSLPANFTLLEYLAREAGELVKYGTAGGILLMVIGIATAVRRGNRTFLWLALFGLEEVVFTYMAYHHDFLTYPMSAFLALAAATGASFLWERGRAGRTATVVLLLLGAGQAAAVVYDRQTTPQPYEIYWRMGTAIREHTRPSERVLLTIRDHKRLTPFYAERYLASRELGDPHLTIRYQGAGTRLPTDEDLIRYIENKGAEYDVIVAGDAEVAAQEIEFYRRAGWRPDDLAYEGFYRTDHPIFKALDRSARSKERAGPFIFYRRRTKE